MIESIANGLLENGVKLNGKQISCAMDKRT